MGVIIVLAIGIIHSFSNLWILNVGFHSIVDYSTQTLRFSTKTQKGPTDGQTDGYGRTDTLISSILNFLRRLERLFGAEAIVLPALLLPFQRRAARDSLGDKRSSKSAAASQKVLRRWFRISRSMNLLIKKKQ